MPNIPDQMKNDNWQLFVLARSNNPEIKIPFTSELVSNLWISVRIAQIKEYDDMLNKCEYWANLAMQILSDNSKAGNENKKDWGEAWIKCESVIKEVGIMIYDPDRKWATPQSGAFKFPVKEAPKEMKM